MTICRMTRLSSATRIFTVGAPFWVERGSVDRERRKSALDGDGERLAAPEGVDAAEVGRGPDGGGAPRVRQAQRRRPRQGRLHVAPDDVGDLAERVDDVLVLELRRRVLAEQRPGEAGRGLAAGGQDDGAGPRADDVDPAGHDVAGELTRDRHEDLVLADQRGPGVLGDRLDGRLVDQLGDDWAAVAAAAAHLGGCHSATSWGSRPSSASLSRSASAVNGLITYSCAPAARARTIWVCSLSDVTIMIVIDR